MKRSIPNISQIQRLLIVKTSSIGDVVHALPLAENLHRANPQLQIGWLVRAKSARVLQGNPHIAALHVVPDRPSLRDLIRVARVLRAQRYDVALDAQGLLLSGLLTRLSGAPVRIGLDRNREGNAWFMTHPCVPGRVGGSLPDRHAIRILFGFADVLGAGHAPPDYPPQNYLARASTASERIMAAAAPRICLNVGASTILKQWPEAHWATLLEELLADKKTVVFVGDKQDATVARSVITAAGAETAPGVINLAGQTSLDELPGILAACDVVVSGDTGPMHMAVAVGTPVVALFGSTSAARTGPYGNANVVLNMHLPCSPCFRKPTCQGRVDCMHAITPPMVLEQLRDMLPAERV